MKSRYVKHLKRIEKRNPVIAFSKVNEFRVGTIVKELDVFNKSLGLDYRELYNSKTRHRIKDIYFMLEMFTDNYLNCGNHDYVYILMKLNDGNYRIIQKETKGKWIKEYWEKEDPNNERDWCYFDEDTTDLYYHLMNSYKKVAKLKDIREYSLSN